MAGHSAVRVSVQSEMDVHVGERQNIRRGREGGGGEGEGMSAVMVDYMSRENESIHRHVGTCAGRAR